MAYDNRMMTYEIIDPITKKVRGRTRINPRLSSFALAITFVTVPTSGSISASPNGRLNSQASIEIQKSKDLELIDTIIKKYPNMLVDKEIITHEVVGGDSLTKLAKDYGTTINRIKELNNRKDNNIYYKEKLTIEKVTPKSDVDKTIALLETYINDYVFSSEYARASRGEIKSFKEQQDLFYKNLYGQSNGPDIDLTSVFGMNINVNAIYNASDKSEEAKINYINGLNAVYALIQEKVNLDGSVKYIIPFEEYSTYVKKGSINSLDYTTTKKM